MYIVLIAPPFGAFGPSISLKIDFSKDVFTCGKSDVLMTL